MLAATRVRAAFETQYIAALGPADARSGSFANAGPDAWGLWPVDPGPRGVRLSDAATLTAAGAAPAGWTFNPSEWWLEEHGLIMEAPTFPLPPGAYIVTGGREKTAVLTVGAPDAAGLSAWSLDADATLHDVTHLRCRAARYTAASACSPAEANPANFPVAPGAAMPPVGDCGKQDYQVLIVIGRA
jgi:hypothetical protein